MTPPVVLDEQPRVVLTPEVLTELVRHLDLVGDAEAASTAVIHWTRGREAAMLADAARRSYARSLVDAGVVEDDQAEVEQQLAAAGY